MSELEKTIVNLERVYKELPLLTEDFPSIRDNFTNGLDSSIRLFNTSNSKNYNRKGGFSYTLFSDNVFPYLKIRILWRYLFSIKDYDTFIERVGEVIFLLKGINEDSKIINIEKMLRK